MHTILGINGAIGPELAAHLNNRGIKVRGVSRRPFPGNWEHRQADVTNMADVLDVVDGSGVVYLLVGLEYNLDVWRRDWPVIMENCIEACLANKAKFVFLDNVYSYGLVKGAMTENTPLHPNSEKGKVRKQIAERLLDAFKNKGLRGCIARAADFYGPNCNTSVLNSTVFERLAAGRSAFVMGRADKIHTYSYTRDLGRALAILGTDNRADDGQVWHLPTSADRWTGADWVKAAAQVFGVKPKFQATPTFVLRLMGLGSRLFREMVEMNYQFTHDYIFSSEKFERTFGIKPTPNQQGVEETAAYYRTKSKSM
ncbi:MAG: NAD-dependent epimerase/dehydratase family protein [Haliscomenobacteraceae bacterium CHB4]|nr:NAD-dependent epimerase/dehydratase family protein [Haliscomenobacteraceae bacterium CHB4]